MIMLVLLLHDWLFKLIVALLQGEPKVGESFWRAIVGIYRVLTGFYGMVRVDFSQPFSVKVCRV